MVYSLCQYILCYGCTSFLIVQPGYWTRIKRVRYCEDADKNGFFFFFLALCLYNFLPNTLESVILYCLLFFFSLNYLKSERIRIVTFINNYIVIAVYFCPSLNAWNNGRNITNRRFFDYFSNKFTSYITFVNKLFV